MTKLPSLSGKNLLAILKKHFGYEVLRQKGSHVFIINNKLNLCTVIPVHANEDLGKGLLRKILNDLELEIDEIVSIYDRKKFIKKPKEITEDELLKISRKAIREYRKGKVYKVKSLRNLLKRPPQ